MFNKRTYIPRKNLDYSISVIVILMMMTYVDISEGNNLQILEQDKFLTDRSVNKKWFTYSKILGKCT